MNNPVAEALTNGNGSLGNGGGNGNVLFNIVVPEYGVRLKFEEDPTVKCDF